MTLVIAVLNNHANSFKVSYFWNLNGAIKRTRPCIWGVSSEVIAPLPFAYGNVIFHSKGTVSMQRTNLICFLKFSSLEIPGKVYTCNKKQVRQLAQINEKRVQSKTIQLHLFPWNDNAFRKTALGNKSLAVITQRVVHFPTGLLKFEHWCTLNPSEGCHWKRSFCLIFS